MELSIKERENPGKKEFRYVDLKVGADNINK